MPPDRAPGKIRAHIAELRDCDQIEAIKLSGHDSRARPRRQIENFGGEIEKPKHIKQPEQRVSHRLQRLVVSQSRKHLPREHRQQKKEQERHFEVVGTGRADGGKIMKTSGQHDRSTDQSDDFEIRQVRVVEHPVKFEQRD